MVGYRGSSAGSYLATPTSPIPSHCASIVATSTLRVKRNYMRLPPATVSVAVAVTEPTALVAVHMYAPCSSSVTPVKRITPFASVTSVLGVSASLLALQHKRGE